MPKKIDSQYLGDLNLAIGLTGAGSPQTELRDDVVFQTLDVNPIARRGGTLGGTNGLFTIEIHNVHTDAEDIVGSVNPYESGVANLPPFPAVVPRGLEIWVLSASVLRASGSGTFTGLLDMGSQASGISINDSGVQVAQVGSSILASWGSIVNRGGGQVIGLADEGGSKLGYRLSNAGGLGAILVFRSSSSATATFVCTIHCGLFPIALGQDGYQI